MVAASATAILNDIDLSTFVRSPQPGPPDLLQNPAKCRLAAGFAHAFLTARVNQGVSASLRHAPGMAIKRKCWKQSKCPENHTRRENVSPGWLAADDYVSVRVPSP
jgi:hypothetical protein